jgi:hypothetical protein
LPDIHFHRRNLPHFYRSNSTYFLTFRLKGSLPKSKIIELQNRAEFRKQCKTKTEKYNRDKKFFYEYDKLLDRNISRIYHLKIFQIANFIKAEIHKHDSIEYNLICYSIMPNHIHLVFSLLENSNSIDKIMQSIKRISAYHSNQFLNKKGSF